MLRDGNVKDDCLHFFTTMTYVEAARTASFWCRDDVMQSMTAGGWTAFIWRTDSWTQVTDGVKVEEGWSGSGLGTIRERLASLGGPGSGD
ncbi:hypothetical protein B0H67DRAFT_566456 [Lasiosphaeris hirsuta]|uniref:Uncharacterized protein n=1 Tax=Lasiosphaeris hirsuta TaxID=260670 RepID=A0AA40BD19_9PEZI|nr:hypothetical protein B0H67DRAFT_566456 [Lasiosphaeris hirsuta]